jgi:hypothetical protein
LDLRRAFHRGLIAAPFVVGAGALSFAAPSFVKNAVVERLARATGLSASVQDADIGLSSVTLRGVTLGESGAPSAAGPAVKIDSIEVDAGLFSLWWSGASAVQAVAVRGVRAVLPLQHAQTRQLIERLRGRGKSESAGSQPAEARGLPKVDLRDAELTVSDADGTLAQISKASAQIENAALSLGAERVQLGGGSVDVSSVQVKMARGAQGIAVAGVAAKDAVLKLPDSEATTAPRPLLIRALEALEIGAADQKAVPAAAALAVAAPAVKPARNLMDRFARDAQLSLARGRVLRHDGSEALSNLSVSAKVEQGGALHLSGEGRSEREGAVGWNLRVWPDALRAEGTVDLKALPLSVLAPLLPSVPWHEPEAARVDASLRLAAESAERIVLAGEVSVQDAALASPRLAPVPVRGIDFSVGGNGYFVPAQRLLVIEKSEASLGSARAALTGSVMWGQPDYAIDLAIKMPMTRCNEAVLSIPNDLLGDLALATWQGSIGGELKIKVDSKDFAATVLDIDINDRCDFVTVPAMADLRRFEQAFVHQVLEPDGTLFEMETGPGTPAWTYLTDISPFFIHAVLAHEDIGFYGHKGFSPLHIKNALARNLEARRYVVGASTITMQLVKNVFLHREKTLGRKIQEVLLTWWIERVMDKSDIIELYFNVIEYGPGVYGIRDAARHYFGRLPAQLSPAEGAYLATILPSPKRYGAQYEKGEPSASTLERMRKLILRMKEKGGLGPESTRFGLEELSHFRFVREGQIAEPRTLPTDAGALPHMAGDALWGVPGGEAPAADLSWDDVAPDER